MSRASSFSVLLGFGTLVGAIIVALTTGGVRTIERSNYGNSSLNTEGDLVNPTSGSSRAHRVRSLTERKSAKTPTEDIDLRLNYHKNLKMIESVDVDVSDPVGLQVFKNLVSKFLSCPNMYQDMLIDNLLRRQIEVAFSNVDWNHRASVMKLFEGFDTVFEVLKGNLDGGSSICDEYLDQFIIGAGTQEIDIGNFIDFVDQADFQGREELYVRAYVVKITGENSEPNFSDIPRSGDRDIDEKLHSGLFKAYAHVDEEQAIRFLSTSGFVGGATSHLARTVVGSFAVRNWPSFKLIVEDTKDIERKKVLVSHALAREDIKRDLQKSDFLSQMLE